MPVGSGAMGASRDRRFWFYFARGGRGGATGPIAAPLSAAALAIGLLTVGLATVDGGKASDIPVRPTGGDGSPGAEWDLPQLADLVLATTPHTVTVRRSTGGEVALGRVSIPSPQRRFLYRVPYAWRFSPYAGAAIGVPVFDRGNTPDPVHDGAVSRYAPGAGMDVKISESWNVRIDARKAFPDGGTTGPGRGVGGREEDSAPWVLGVDFGFLF